MRTVWVEAGRLLFLSFCQLGCCLPCWVRQFLLGDGDCININYYVIFPDIIPSILISTILNFSLFSYFSLFILQLNPPWVLSPT